MMFIFKLYLYIQVARVKSQFGNNLIPEVFILSGTGVISGTDFISAIGYYCSVKISSKILLIAFSVHLVCII